MNQIKTIDQQISKLQTQGVLFELCSEASARIYLQQNSNFFRLSSYLANFYTYQAGNKLGTYQSLDFAMLQDLQELDRVLQATLITMTSDVERYSKNYLLSVIIATNEDGYQIVNDYLSSLSDKYYQDLMNEFQRYHRNPYLSSWATQYAGQWPVWVFLELITFGTFIDFYRYCGERLTNKKLTNDYYQLLTIKSIRNALAHNNCLINDLKPTTPYKITYQVTQALASIGISDKIRNKKLANPRINDITHLLFNHRNFVTINPTIKTQLSNLTSRIRLNQQYYINNDTLATSFEFILKIIDNWFLN